MYRPYNTSIYVLVYLELSNNLRQLLRLFQQLVNLEALISTTELLHEFPPFFLALLRRAAECLEAVELLQAHQQPLALINADSPVFSNATLHQHKLVTVDEICVVRNRCVRLCVLAAQLKLGEVCEEDRRSGLRRECPLQEMDLGALIFLGQRNDELWVLASRCDHATESLSLHGRAEGLPILHMAQTPDGLEFSVGQGGALFQVDEAVKRPHCILARALGY